VTTMDKENKYQRTDPADLLSKNYEPVEMRDDFRRELSLKTRAVVASRRRVPIIHWAAAIAAIACLALLAVPVWRSLHSTPKHRLSATAGGAPPVKRDVTAAPLDHHSVVGTAKQPWKNRNSGVPIAADPRTSAGTSSSENGSSQRKPAPHISKEPLVALISVQQPVTNGAGRSLKAGDRIPSGVPIITGHGGRVTLVTRKGSELHLDSNSELVFASSSVAAISQGRLYCSDRDSEIGRIDTPAGQVRLLGTIVDTAIRKDTAAVTVVKGRVQLWNRHGSALVGAGKRSLLRAFARPDSGATVNAYRETSWYQGRGEVESDFGDIAYKVARRANGLSEIWTVNANGSNRHRVASYIGDVTVGAWIPGERWVNLKSESVCWRGRDVLGIRNSDSPIPILKTQNWMLDTATGRTVATGHLPDGYRPYSEGLNCEYPSPDQTKIALLGFRDLPNGKTEQGLYVYDTTTGRVKALLEGDILNVPAWAPDNRHIAVSSTWGSSIIDYNLVIIDIDTGHIRNLHINGAGASFSPDGRKIAYCGDCREPNYWWALGVVGTGSIFVVDLAAGAKPARLSPADEWAVQPRWSPDGKSLMYRSARGTSLTLVNPDGSNRKDILRTTDCDIVNASWAPSGRAVYVTLSKMLGGRNEIRRIAVDGSNTATDLISPASDGTLAPDEQEQTDAAVTALKEAVARYGMGCIHRFEGDLVESRQSFKSAAGMFAQLVWSYPLSGLRTEDTLRYADMATRTARATDQEMLAESCRERMEALKTPLTFCAHRNGLFAADIGTLRTSLLSSYWWTGAQDGETWRGGWLASGDVDHSKLMFACPGTGSRAARPYVYATPRLGASPSIGDVIVRCPLHRSSRIVWDEGMDHIINERIAEKIEPGETCHIRYDNIAPGDRVPYRFENIGTVPLTVIYHTIRGTYDVRGKTRLLPTPRVYENQEFRMGPLDEGSAARDIDSGPIDWGHLEPWDKQDVEEKLKWCRAVAQYEAKLPVEYFKVIEGEPARLMYSGGPGGSCDNIESGLWFELLGPGRIELYQLKPSGRFRVSGTVRVFQTGQVCKNGWIDKNGKVISTEKL
jgi:Tol biopolymer transport system component/ferric-dicitrate binding protein FerR (iron transport regulator)